MKYDFEIDLDEQSSVGRTAAQTKPGSEVLEFGPGDDRLTRYLIGIKQYEVGIVELGKELLDFVSEFAQDGSYGDIESLRQANYYARQAFDYVLFADVLEHLVDPGKTLKKVREFLSEERGTLITFPNLAHNSVVIDLFNNQLSWASYGLLDETHNFFYTHDGFQEVFEKAGLYINIEGYSHLAVGGTELKSTYEELPEAVRYDFRMRPFDEVYQYFFSSMKHPVAQNSITQPQNSSYVEILEVIQQTKQDEIIQQIPFSNFTGENETLSFHVSELAERMVFRSAQQPSLIEFSAEAAGKKLTFTDSNAVVKTVNDCYLFGGKDLPEFFLASIAGKEVTIHCHYHFIGELTPAMKELLEAIRPVAEVTKQLSEKNDELERENHYLIKSNTRLDQTLRTTISHYCTLLESDEWTIKHRLGRRKKETSKKIREKELSLCIGEKIQDTETKTLRIIGWGTTNSDHQPLSYKLSADQSPFFEAIPVLREGASQAKQLAEEAKAGFELRILCEKERSFLVEAMTQNGQSWIIEM